MRLFQALFHGMGCMASTDHEYILDVAINRSIAQRKALAIVGDHYQTDQL